MLERVVVSSGEGLEFAESSTAVTGVTLCSIADGSPGAASGRLFVGDLVEAINGSTVHSRAEAEKLLASDEVVLGVRRAWRLNVLNMLPCEDLLTFDDTPRKPRLPTADSLDA